MNGPALPTAQDTPRATEGPAPVLIVEDEVSIAETIAMIAEDAGHTAIIAANGRQALALALRHAPALIITDLMMPVMGGVEFLATLRAEYPSTGQPLPPIIVMTAASSRYAEDLSPDAILPKPFRIAELEGLLTRFLGEAPGH